MRFKIEFTASALDDLAYLRKYEQSLILDQVEAQLTFEPLSETRNRKPLEDNSLAERQLRIGVYRVFYDVSTDEATVKVKAVGYKKHNALYLRGKECTL
jgi:mRNA-degrading endonuclease RelE of RelBE toxin-antitoxin system